MSEHRQFCSISWHANEQCTISYNSAILCVRAPRSRNSFRFQSRSGEYIWKSIVAWPPIRAVLSDVPELGTPSVGALTRLRLVCPLS
jgi:hypothetical protein